MFHHTIRKFLIPYLIFHSAFSPSYFHCFVNVFNIIISNFPIFTICLLTKYLPSFYAVFTINISFLYIFFIFFFLFFFYFLFLFFLCFCFFFYFFCFLFYL